MLTGCQAFQRPCTFSCWRIHCKLHSLTPRFTMAQYRDDPAQNAPEVHNQHDAGLYPAEQTAHAYALPSGKTYDDAPPVDLYPAPAAARQGWKRWWILALIGLFIALLAGLVGGFIGQAIQKGREPSSVPPAATNGNSSASTPPQNLANGTVGTIVIPQTGCNFETSRDRNRLSNTTVYSKKRYTTICNSGWVDFLIVGLWTLTPSDCMEACIAYNLNAPTQRPCVGGGFVPSWTNQTLANIDLGGPPLNCYLQSNSSGVIPNDQEKLDNEVVALCLDGKCNDVKT
jgi:hypothetical protein